MKLLNCILITICLFLTITACAVNTPTAPVATLTATPTYKVTATRAPTDTPAPTATPSPTPRVNDIDLDNIKVGDVFLGLKVVRVEQWLIIFEGEIAFVGTYEYVDDGDGVNAGYILTPDEEYLSKIPRYPGESDETIFAACELEQPFTDGKGRAKITIKDFGLGGQYGTGCQVVKVEKLS